MRQQLHVFLWHRRSPIHHDQHHLNNHRQSGRVYSANACVQKHPRASQTFPDKFSPGPCPGFVGRSDESFSHCGATLCGSVCVHAVAVRRTRARVSRLRTRLWRRFDLVARALVLIMRRSAQHSGGSAASAPPAWRRSTSSKADKCKVYV